MVSARSREALGRTELRSGSGFKSILAARNQARRPLQWSRQERIVSGLDLGGCTGAEHKLTNLRYTMEVLTIVC